MDVKEKIAHVIKPFVIQSPIDAISVKDICQKADVSRQTFYKCFKDKYDLIFWVFKGRAEQNCNEYIRDHDYHKFMVQTLHIFKDDLGFYRHVFNTIESQNSFFYQYVNYSVDTSLNMIGHSQMDAFKTRVLRLFCYGVAMEIHDWVMSGANEDCESFARIIEAALPAMLQEDYYYKRT